jgi:NAD(P)-dependent dehydrogenase (short-subunit alcohol dehydrogenase family)
MIIIKRFISLRMDRLQHKVALITGGNSGIGLATAKEFIAQGAKVIITGRSSAAVAEAAAELGEGAVGIVSDAARLTDVQRLPDLVQSHFPRIDVLFINAGIAQFAPIAEMSERIFDQTMDTNFKGAYFTIQALLPLMADGGSIILNTSINAHIGMPGASIYAASKAALISLARNLSAELLPRRIRVNAISPGPVVTPLHSTGKLGISEGQLQQMGDHILRQLPIGRFGTSEEIAKAALFFASDDSSFVLGAEHIADGGMATL